MHSTNEKFTVPPPASAPPPSYEQPAATGYPVGSNAQYAQGRGEWSSGLCDCCSDVSNCCITCWCPCITFGQIAEIADKGTTSCGVHGALYTLIAMFTGCGCLYSCVYRTKLRRQYQLPERPCGDCLVHFCCDGCALCQEYRELKSRGFDMSLGWEGNMARQGGGGVTMAPQMNQGMTR